MSGPQLATVAVPAPLLRALVDVATEAARAHAIAPYAADSAMGAALARLSQMRAPKP